MKSRKAVIHIGGSYLQLPSIRLAKELGLYVVITDKNPDAPGRLLADQFEIIDGTDVQSLLALAHRVNCEYELAGAYASSDFGLLAVAVIAEAFGRPGASRLAVERALDKSLSKNIWSQEKMATPKGVTVKDQKTLLSVVDELGLPVIVKPTSSSGSQGVRSVRRTEDLWQAYMSAQRFSDSVLVEQLISGHHIDVNGLFVESRFVPCGTMDRFFSDPPWHYPVWGCQPSSLNETQERAVYALVERAARSLGIDAGPVKADVVWIDSGPVILELAPRFHGDVSTAHVTPLATGGSPIKAWIAYLTETADPLEYIGQVAIRYAGWMALFPSAPGRLLAVDGIEAARSVKGIQDVFIARKPGDAIKQATDNTALFGFIWAIAANRDELLENLITSRSTIDFVIN